MVSFAVRFNTELPEEQQIIAQYMTEINERLQSDNLVKNPFNGGVRFLETQPNVFVYVISIHPVYFATLWNRLIPQYAFLYSLRKKRGYKGKIKYLSDQETIKTFLEAKL